MHKKGLTLVEALIAFAIFVVLFTAMTSVWIQSNSASRVGRAQQELQQEARKALDRVVQELRRSSLKWVANSLEYCLAINSAGDQLDFYLPAFDNNGDIISLEAVRYYVGGPANNQLLRRTGAVDKVVATDIDNSINQKPFFGFTNSLYTAIPCNLVLGGGCCTGTDCESCAVTVKMPIIKDNYTFNLSSSAALRNREIDLGGIEVTEIEEEQ